MADDGIVSSRGASIFFGVCFTALAVTHFGLMIWKKTWFMLWLIVGCILELTGYFGTTAGHGSQSVQVIIAPVFLAASVYINLGKVLKQLEISILIVNSCFQSTLFIVGDVLCFGLLLSGVVLGMIDNHDLGTGLVIGGFILQIILFSGFGTLIVLSHRRLRKNSFPCGRSFYNWKTGFWALYAIMALFLVRSVFRLIEFAQGWGGYIFRHAAFVYIFDASTMVLACVVLVIIHPGFVRDSIQNTVGEKPREADIL